jgi:hypothetical protein
MLSVIHEWARAHAVSPLAVNDLMQRLGMGFEPFCPTELSGQSETAIQNVVRLGAAKAGIVAWRNNVGAYEDKTGRFVRYGLCNDTKQLNEKIKSGDLIGINPMLVTPAHVGTVVGQFWSREIKHGGWKFTGTKHEMAQQKWVQIVTSLGGNAGFSTGGI